MVDDGLVDWGGGGQPHNFSTEEKEALEKMTSAIRIRTKKMTLSL